MRKRDVVGKRVVDVIQERRSDLNGGVDYAVTALVFEDGSQLHPATAEHEGGYATLMIYYPPEGKDRA